MNRKERGSMNRKEELLERLVVHHKSNQKEMMKQLASQVAEIVHHVLGAVGKEDDANKVATEFAAEILPYSILVSRETCKELYTEAELEVMVDLYDRHPWWIAKNLAFSASHAEKLKESGGEIANRVLKKYMGE